MNPLPYQKLEYHSPLTMDEAVERLTQKIDSDPPFLNWKFGKLERPFKGTLQDGRFELSKVVGNSGGSPLIIGEIVEDEKGSVVHITIKLSRGRIVIMAFFYILILALSLVFLLGANISVLQGMPVPIMIILFSYTVATLLFKFHASFIKDDLREIFLVAKYENKKLD